MRQPILEMINDKLINGKRAQVLRSIRSLPPGMVSSYGAIARAAEWPGAARQVVRILRQVPGLPWHRVVGSGGAIKLTGENAAEQRFRLQMEGVSFRGARVDMKRHEFKFRKSVPSTRYPVSRNSKLATKRSSKSISRDSKPARRKSKSAPRNS